MQTHIIVPTAATDRLRIFAHSLARHTLPCHVILSVNTDNPGDAQRAMLWADMLPGEVDFLYVPKRTGYTPAVDKAWRLVRHEPDDDVVMVLNDGVEFTGDWLPALVAPLGYDNGYVVGQVGPSLKWVGRRGFWGSGMEGELYQYVEGWCWASTVGTINVAGGIVDMRFAPGLCEDQDLSIRIVRLRTPIGKRYRIWQVPDLPVTYARSVSTPPSEEKTLWFARNREYLTQKWDLMDPGWREDNE